MMAAVAAARGGLSAAPSATAGRAGLARLSGWSPWPGRPRVEARSLAAAAAAGGGGEAPAPPGGRYTCDGFFVAVDPNVGLGSDTLNPTWRLCFTDEATKERQRVPYKMIVHHRGPHAECAIRLQCGFVSCEGSFASVPKILEVESSWEVTIPLPMAGVRFSTTSLVAANAGTGNAPVSVYCVDYSAGPSIGVQRSSSGVGVKGVPDFSSAWRSDAALAAFVFAAISSAITLARLPDYWEKSMRRGNRIRFMHVDREGPSTRWIFVDKNGRQRDWRWDDDDEDEDDD